MPQYRQFQPRAYQPKMSAYWYFDRWPYLKFMLREASSVFVAWFAVVILLQLNALISGAAAYANFQRCRVCALCAFAVPTDFLPSDARR